MSQKVTPIAIQPVRAPRPRSAGGHGRAERTAPLTHFLPPYSKRRPGAGIHLKNRPKPQGGRGTPDRALQVVAGAPPALLDRSATQTPSEGRHPPPAAASWRIAFHVAWMEGYAERMLFLDRLPRLHQGRRPAYAANRKREETELVPPSKRSSGGTGSVRSAADPAAAGAVVPPFETKPEDTPAPMRRVRSLDRTERTCDVGYRFFPSHISFMPVSIMACRLPSADIGAIKERRATPLFVTRSSYPGAPQGTPRR